MSEQSNNTPLLELARSVPKDLRAEWETQWFDDGTPCGHSMAPVGRYIHQLADEIEKLRAAEMEALGWMYAEACALLDKGIDLRNLDVPEIVERYKSSTDEEDKALKGGEDDLVK